MQVAVVSADMILTKEIKSQHTGKALVISNNSSLGVVSWAAGLLGVFGTLAWGCFPCMYLSCQTPL